jgi:hypothetical protein
VVLAFTSNHIGAAFDKLFGLSGVPDDYTEFDTSVLLRSAQKDRIDAIVTGVQGGVFSPSEARNLEGLDGAAYGDEPRFQQQVVLIIGRRLYSRPSSLASASSRIGRRARRC